MITLHRVKDTSIALLCGALFLSISHTGRAQGAKWAGYPDMPYNAGYPARPVTTSSDARGNYTSAQITAQVTAGTNLVTAVQKAISGHKTSYTVPTNGPTAGVYRFTGSGAVVSMDNVSNFTLNAAGCVFVMANPKAYLLSVSHDANRDHLHGSSLNIILQGSDSAPLIVDRDLLSSTQGTIKSYEPSTGVLTVTIMPGYSNQITPAANVTAYTAAGGDIPYGYYHSIYGAYTSGQSIDATTIQVTTDKNGASRYAPGNFVTLPTPNDSTYLCFLYATTLTNLTLKNIANGSGGPIFGTNGSSLAGLTQMIRVKNGPLPGTNRLGAGFFAQTVSPRGSVVMDGCEFGGSDDDGMDIQSSHLNMYYQTSSANPNQMLVWQIYGGTDYAQGDTVSIFANSNFAEVCTAKVTAVVPYLAAAPTTTDASNLWNSFRRRTKSGGSLALITLDKPVTGTTPGDYIENDSDRMASFTMTNCYWHQIGVRVMIEGIQQGNFTHNTFDSVNGGLALVADPYWAQGGTCQNVTIDHNVFRNCDVNSTQAVGALVLGPYWGSGGASPDQDYSFQNFTIINNTFTGPSLEFIHAHMVGGLNVSHNVFSNGQGKAIGLYGCNDVRVFGNSIDHNSGPTLNITDSDSVDVFQNFMDNILAPNAPIAAVTSTNVTQEDNVLSNTYYTLLSVWNDKAAGIYGASHSNNAKAVQWTNAGQKDHNWVLIPVGGGLYKIQNQNSGKYLVPLNQNATASAVIGQYDDGPGPDHLWLLLTNKDHVSFRLKNALSGLDLSVFNWSTQDGAVLVQGNDAATVDRYWKFVTP